MNIQQQLIHAPNWEERYRLIIQAGRNLPLPSAQQLSEMQQISGCEVNVWFKKSPKTDRTLNDNSIVWEFQAYSEARIMNGLLWILLQEIDGKTSEQLHQFDIHAFYQKLGIANRLTTTRLNGLKQIEDILHSI